MGVELFPFLTAQEADIDPLNTQAFIVKKVAQLSPGSKELQRL